MKLKGNGNEPRCTTVAVVVDDDGSDVVILLCQSTVKVEGTVVRGDKCLIYSKCKIEIILLFEHFRDQLRSSEHNGISIEQVDRFFQASIIVVMRLLHLDILIIINCVL